MKRVPEIDLAHTPLSVVELLYGTRVAAVMSTELITCTTDTPMREVQHLMRDNGITGLPVVDDHRLLGIISVDDLIRALGAERLDCPASEHMTSQVVTLDQEMPLSVAISYFNRYPFGRFPVLNAKNQLAGILTVRDINVAMIRALMAEVDKLESLVEEQEPDAALSTTRVFTVRRHDFERGGQASTEIKRHLKKHGVHRADLKRVAVASYELEINQVAHSLGGTMSYHVTPTCVEILAQDRGPGIEDTEAALTEGFTTADEWIKSLGFGAGLGLPNVQRVADDFFIHSSTDVGTTVKATINLTSNPEKTTP
jgi:CBS domain-containing protein/anti-sigma regulatory factor (Ser/Thr protein kinase)